MKTQMSNYEMAVHIEELYKYLDHRDIIGYAAARNIRKLKDAAAEFLTRRDELVNKYGSPYLDEDGNDTGKKFISPNAPQFNEVSDELTAMGSIKHHVDIFRITYDSVMNVLSGSEILELEWMLKDS